MIRIGTPYFVSYSHALQYYGHSIIRKLEDGEIFIGEPPYNKDKGEYLTVIKGEGRYQINSPEKHEVKK